MAKKSTLNAKNLEALGAERLAELLLEVTEGNAAAKRRLRIELAGADGPAAVAREVGRRLATIARSRSFVDWSKVRTLAHDLETQLTAIVEQVAPSDPEAALDLMWRFMAVAEPVHDRTDDSDGMVGDVFRSACAELGRIAAAAQADPRILADRAFEALRENDYAQFDGLIRALTVPLGPAGMGYLRDRMVELSRTEGGNRIIRVSRLALMEIADALGDVDSFMAQYDEESRKSPPVAIGIAERLLAAGRGEEAVRALDAAEHGHGGWRGEWEDVRIRALDALGRAEEAQAARWSSFERSLSVEHLRVYLARDPGFDTVEVEERAFAHVMAFPRVDRALAFLLSWPSLERGAALVMARSGELNGDYYELLTPAAEALALDHPLAATLTLRPMIDFTLREARSTRYKHAARHLEECAALARAIHDFGAVETHDAYMARLRNEHGKKRSFWGMVE